MSACSMPAARISRASRGTGAQGPGSGHSDAAHATGLDRNELGALLVAAGLGTAAEHALVSLLALNGLRLPEATSVVSYAVPAPS